MGKNKTNGSKVIFRKCKNCFRFREDWKEVADKGLESRKDSCIDYSYRPREGIRTHCTCRDFNETISPDFSCKYYYPRFLWNLELWWSWHFKYSIDRAFCRFIRVPIGRLREPAVVNYFDDGMPICPHCGEPTYSDTQCQFCGQRLIIVKEQKEPEPIDCSIADDGHIVCNCGSRNLDFASHIDGMGFYINGFKCRDCGQNVSVKYWRKQ